MTTKYTLASAFDIAQTPAAIREIAHLHNKVLPVEKNPRFTEKPLYDVVTVIANKAILDRKSKSDMNGVFMAGLLLALPDAPDCTLLLGCPVNDNTEYFDERVVEAYALPKDIAKILRADSAWDLDFSFECPHIPLGGRLSFNRVAPHFSVMADAELREELNTALFERYKLTDAAQPFIALLLSQFWVKSYEPNYFAFPHDNDNASKGLVFSFPSLLRAAGLCIAQALKKVTNPLDTTTTINLDFASRDMGNYSKLIQNDYTPFYWGSQDFFLTATWETAIAVALEKHRESSLKNLGWSNLSGLQCITEKFKSSAEFFSPKNLVVVAELSGEGSSTKSRNAKAKASGQEEKNKQVNQDQDVPREAQSVFEVGGESVYTPIEGKQLCSLFTHPSSEYTTTLFSNKSEEVSEQAKTVAALIGEERAYKVKPVQRFSSKSLRNAFCLEMDMAVRYIDKLTQEIEENQVIPF